MLAYTQIRIGNCGKWKYIKMNERDTVTQTCPGDIKNDWKYFSFAPGIPPLHIVVTDTFGNIELVRPFMSANFETFKPGFYRVYGLYYPFTYYLKKGKNIFRDTMGSYCYGFTENFVLINNNAPEAGEISLAKGIISNLICPAEDTDMRLQFRTSSPFSGYTYLLTNSQQVIVDINKEGLFDFRNLPSGKYYVHGLAYSGELLADIGKRIDDGPLSKNCFTKSIKSIEVEKKQAKGGEIFLQNSQISQKYFCTQFVSDDSLKMIHTGETYLDYSFLVLDGNNTIKGVEKEASIGLKKYPTGSYKVIGISHLYPLEDLINQPLAKIISGLSCFQISKNQLEIFIENIKITDVASNRSKGDSIWCVNAPKSLRLNAIGSGAENLNVVWVATTTDNKVVDIKSKPDSILLSEINENLIQYYAIAYTGTLKLKIGDNLFQTDLASGCFDIANQSYTVRKKEAKGGKIRFLNTNQITNICLTQNANYYLQVSRFNALGEKYIFLLTNSRKEILSSSINGYFSIKDLNSGQYEISGLSYTGSLSFGTGSRIDTTIFSNECYSLSENSLNFQKTITDGSVISFIDGQNMLSTCKGLKVKTFELKNNSLVTQKYAYAVTNESGKIIQIEKSNTLQLTDSSLLVYFIRGIAYSGELTLKLGDNINNRNLASGCHSLSQNKLTINFDNLSAGELSPQKMTFCLSPNEIKSIPIILNQAAGNYAWLICDANNTLLEIQHSVLPTLKRGLPGILKIFGFAYLDQPSFQIGKKISQQQFGISCFEVTANAQEIIWSEIDGGQISINGSIGDLTVCQSALTKPIQLAGNSAAEGDQYVYLVTDRQNKLLATYPTNQIDLSSFEGGKYLIYGLSFAGNLHLKIGDIIPRQNVSSACESWSKNALYIEITGTSVGKISFEGGKETVQLCAKKNIQSLTLNPLSANAVKKTFLLTSEDGRILSIFNTKSLPNIDHINGNILRIYGLGYSGNLTARLDSNIFISLLSTGCYQLSENFLTINRSNLSGGFVALNNNQTQIQFCPTDSMANILTLRNIASQGQQVIFLITNVNNFILDTTSSKNYDFNKQGLGDYRIYALSYNGSFSGKIGVSINDPTLSDECFGISSNFISVAKRNPVAGFVVMDDANTVLQNCPSDQNFPSRQIRTIGNSAGKQVFVVIDSANSIVDILYNPTIYPTEYKVGIFTIVSISYNGELAVKIGDKWGEKVPSNVCYAISANEIQFVNVNPKGGRIKIAEGDTSNICVGLNNPTKIKMSKDSSNILSYSYLITDSANKYLGHFTDTELLSFNDFTENRIHVWGLSHTGTIILKKGDNISTVDIASGCFQLSGNFISLRLNQFRRHLVKSTFETDSLLICTGDGQPNLVTFSNTDNASGISYKYVLTSITNNIIQVLNGTTIDLENIGLRDMRLYSVAFNGQFIGQNGVITNTPLSTGCYNISDNFIKILRDRPSNHRILFSNNDTIQKLCLSTSGSIARLKSTFSGKTGYVYIVLDKNNKIIHLSNSANIDIEKFPDGDYQVYGLSYTGTLLLKTGNTFNLLDNFSESCFRLSSNVVRFYKGGYAEGGSISTFHSTNTIFSCPQDGIADLIDINTPNNPLGTKYQFLVTDSLNQLYYAPFENQLINFNNTPAGIYRIYGVAFTGDLGYQIGKSILNGSLLNACYDLSDNYLSIYHNRPEPGQISKRDGTIGKTLVTLNNNQKDSLWLRVNNAKPANVPYVFILVNENNKIIAQHIDRFDLDTLKIGKYKIYGVASTNPTIPITNGQFISELGKAENCILLSTNFLEVEVTNTGSDPILNNYDFKAPHQPDIGFTTFPNPVRDYLHIHIHQQDEPISSTAQVRITHISGSIIYEGTSELSKGNLRLSLPMSQYQVGLYLLSVQIAEKQFTGKILKVE
jgi:hypothetical protein